VIGPDVVSKGRWDVEFWSREFLGISLHPGQIEMAQAYLARTSSRWRALYLWLMVAAGNRAGKTLGLTVIILHSSFYKMGLKPPNKANPREVEKWGKAPYHWWHFAIEQGPAEQVFREAKGILDGRHPAQKDGCPWADAVGGAAAIATVDVKERGEYAWIKFSDDLGGAEIHFRSTKQNALGSLGQNMHGVSFDEAGLATNLDYLVKEVFHARRLGTGGPLIFISTPSVATSTEFEDYWYEGDPEDPFSKPRRLSLRMSTRQNIGFGIDREDFDALVEGMDKNWIDQNIDGRFIQADTVWFHTKSVDAAFKEDLPVDQPPKPGRVYIQALDPGLKDKCWSLVFDVYTNGKCRGVSIERMQGKQTTPGIVALGVRNHQLYEQKGKAWIETGVDTTALGGHMFRDLLEEHIPIKSVEFGGSAAVKRKMLSDLRSAFDEGKIEMPASGDWIFAKKQCRNYKLADRKMEQDLVMALAIVVKLLRQAPAVGVVDPDARKFDYYNDSDDPRHRVTVSRDLDMLTGRGVPF